MEKTPINIVILSGLAGAGKTTASFAFEASGYYVVDDLPLKMVPGLLALFKNEAERYQRVALILPLKDVGEVTRLIRRDPAFSLISIGLDCQEAVLLSRYKLTRHIHPLMTSGYSLEEALENDRQALARVRDDLDVYIDTSSLGEKELRSMIFEVLRKDGRSNLNIFISSFGFKYGLPLDADTVIDARILDNPYWVKELAPLTGLDEEVKAFIEKDPKTEKFLKAIFDYLDVFLPLSEKDGRIYLSVAVGCSGGQHRSVYIARKIYERYEATYRCSLHHRELPRYLK